MSVRPRVFENPRNLIWPLVVAAILVAGLVARTGLTGGEIELPGWLIRLRGIPVTLYLSHPVESYLVPVTRILSEGQATPTEVIRSLSTEEWDSLGLSSPLTDGAVVQNLSQEGGVVRLELAYDPQRPLPAVALAQSLGTLPEVNFVEIAMNGVPRNSDDRLLYFAAGELLVAESIVAQSPEEALSAYLRGPSVDSLMGLPEDVRLLDYRLTPTNGLLSVNLTYTPSVRELALEQPDSIRRVLVGLIATLTAFEEVEAVRLDFEGHTRLGLGQCSDLLRAPQIQPQVLNDERVLGG
ncbi:MAG: GerMN domain-containing protein [Anaerolineales bacterium]